MSQSRTHSELRLISVRSQVRPMRDRKDHAHVDGLHAWFIDGELQQHGTVCEEMEEYEWCFWYLKVRGVPLENGWLPEPFAFFFDEEE